LAHENVNREINFSTYPRYTTPTTAAHNSAKLLAAATTAPLFELDDGAGPLLVSLPVVVAAADELADEDVRVALLIVVFLCIEVPVAALPLAPTPVPTTPVPTGAAVVVELAVTTGVVEFVLPPRAPPVGADAATVEAATVAVDETEAETEEDETEAETEEDETVEKELEPPVRVIMPV